MIAETYLTTKEGVEAEATHRVRASTTPTDQVIWSLVAIAQELLVGKLTNARQTSSMRIQISEAKGFLDFSNISLSVFGSRLFTCQKVRKYAPIMFWALIKFSARVASWYFSSVLG